ncbi:MAG: hypothetical protein KJ077_41905 [Anaerolineae bacterium]|nr:hypothetical protein [Anaerolineae bacterium]
MGQVNFALWFDNLKLGPGESGIFFEDNISRTNANRCWFVAVPVNPLTAHFVANAHMIKITRVFHIIKGKAHARSGAARTGTIQVYVTVRNFNSENTVTFQLYKTEISRWHVAAQG